MISNADPRETEATKAGAIAGDAEVGVVRGSTHIQCSSGLLPERIKMWVLARRKRH
jgi:hypothetical protein